MDNQILHIKLQQRLNKLGSFDYDNVECWQFAEAFNKAQIEWVRRQLHGNNLYKEATEQSLRRIDDLQNLLKSVPLKGSNQIEYFESQPIPEDYLQFNRLGLKGAKGECSDRKFKVYQTSEASVEHLLQDELSKPSFEWGETFSTMIGNKVRIYTAGEFAVLDSTLTYYRKPKEVQFLDCINLKTGENFTKDQHCEFKDDIVELLIDEAVSILAGDIENQFQMQRNQQNPERNN